MAERVEIFDVACPALTAATSPVEVACAFDPGLVVKVFVVIPDGHSGLTGIALAVGHQPTVPFNRKAAPGEAWKFIEGNDEVVPIDLQGLPDSGAWSAFLYNTDEIAHSWQLRFLVDELPRAPVTSVAGPVPASAIEAVGLEGPGAPGGAEGQETPATGEPGEGAPPELPEPPAGVETPLPGEPGEGEAPPEPIAPPAEPEGEAEPGEPAGVVLDLGEGEGEGPEPAGAPAPGSHPAKRKPPKHSKRPAPPKTRVVVTHLQLPAGGWLPHGARYSERRVDQGQDGITAWGGPIIAPGDFEVVAVLHDRGFPSGFGPSYPVLRITTGRFAGHDWYVGHCTSTVHVGHRGHQGDVVARADQGHVEGGGWFEIGEAPGGVPGPMGNGARWHHLFSTLVITHTRRETVRQKGKKAPTKGHAHAAPTHSHRRTSPPGSHTRRPPAHAPAAGRGRGRKAPPAAAPKAHAPAPGARPSPRPAPARPAPRPSPRPAPRPAPPPAARRPPPPPPPPPRRAPPPPPPRRHR